MPSSKHDLLTLHWSEGSGRNLAKNKNYAGHWATFKKKFASPLVTPEKRKAFDKLSKEAQDDLKKMAGWISGATFDGHWRNKKNLRDRDLMTLDIDYPFDGIIEMIDAGVFPVSHFVGLWHSSRRHTPDKPRIRGFFPLSRAVTADEYVAITRHFAYLIDKTMRTVDKVTFRPVQMMFLPTCSKDDRPHYYYHVQDGAGTEVLDVDAFLDEIEEVHGSWKDISKLPHHPDEGDSEFRQRAEKAEDPLEKRGPVGDFCRAYPDIEVAMEKFIPGFYTPGDEHSGNPRYSYRDATSSNGAIIYEGKFLYSFHGTDPCAEQLVNAFDLIRIHLFGEEDKDKDFEKVSDRPSYKKMIEFIKDDPGYRKAVAARKYAGLESFADIEEDESDEEETDDHDDPVEEGDQPDATGEPDGRAEWEAAFDGIEPEEPADEEPEKERVAPKRKFIKPPKGWFTKLLETNQDGNLVASLSNIKLILQFDKRFWGKIGFNEFTQRTVLLGTIDFGLKGMKPLVCKDPINGDPWQDHMDNALHVVFESPRGDEIPGYGVRVAVGDIRMAVDNVARTNGFHPIREYLTSLKWDGVPRAERLFIDYLGEADTPYAREVARMFLTAACYRVMTPGFKWDNMLIIQGGQGTRKSTFVNRLAGRAWFGELHARLDDFGRIAEQIGGAWLLEMPELAGFTKTDANHLKSFSRKVKDNWRMAYMQHIAELPRQFALVGTTNQDKVLKDDTGNRTYLMLRVHVNRIDTDKLERERDQIWAEAMTWHAAMRAATPEGDLPLEFRSEEAITEAVMRQNGARLESLTERLVREVLDWADTPITLHALRQEMGLGDVEEAFEASADQMVLRTSFREKDVREILFKQDKASFNPQTDAALQQVFHSLPNFGWRKAGERTNRRTRFGIKGIWFDREGPYGAEGYTEYDDFNAEDYV